jgi:hypothetical protein
MEVGGKVGFGCLKHFICEFIGFDNIYNWYCFLRTMEGHMEGSILYIY